MKSKNLFLRKANRIIVWFNGYGPVPLAQQLDDLPKFETDPPRKIGDDAIIFVEGQRRLVRLLRSTGHVVNSTYLVDMGPAYRNRLNSARSRM